MKSAPAKVGCIILAAGLSTRFGSPKQLVKFRGKTLVQNAVDSADASNADYVLLVVGADSDNILTRLNERRAQLILNKNFRDGISTSIKSGISNLPRDCDAAIIMVADQPFLQSRHLDALIEEFNRLRSSGVTSSVALSQGHEPRSPVLLPKQVFPAVQELTGDMGARELVRKQPHLQLVEVDDPRVFADIDTKDSLEALENEIHSDA